MYHANRRNRVSYVVLAVIVMLIITAVVVGGADKAYAAETHKVDTIMYDYDDDPDALIEEYSVIQATKDRPYLLIAQWYLSETIIEEDGSSKNVLSNARGSGLTDDEKADSSNNGYFRIVKGQKYVCRIQASAFAYADGKEWLIPSTVKFEEMLNSGDAHVFVNNVELTLDDEELVMRPWATGNLVFDFFVYIPKDTTTFTFEPGIGSGKMPSVEIDRGEMYTLPACEFTAPSGKIFKNWYVVNAAGGTGTYYSPGAQITAQYEKMIVRASWEDKPANNCEEQGLIHNFPNKATVIREATCGLPGITAIVCKTCKYTEYKITEPTGDHLYRDWITKVEATCAHGVEYHKCTKCGNIEERITDPITTEHTWREGVVTAEPTCTETGTMLYTCMYCGETKEETIDALGHDYQEVSGTAVEATCTETGKEADQKCMRCGDEKVGEVIGALGHDYQEVSDSAKDPTCTETGKKADQKCTRCSDEIIGEAIGALGHDYQEVPGTAVEATCKYPGKKADQKCTRCSDDIVGEVIPVTDDHTWGEGVVTIEPTLDSEGEREYTCEVCGKKKTEVIPKLGKFSVTFESNGGSEVDSLSVTEGNTVTEPAAPVREFYDFTGWYTDKDLNSEYDFSTHVTGDLILYAGWNHGDDHDLIKTEAREATCTDTGNITFYMCSICEKVYRDAAGTEEIAYYDTETAPKGHEFGEWSKLNDDQHQRICGNDPSHVETQNHVWGEPVITEATSEKEGQKKWTCLDCGAVRTEIIPKTASEHQENSDNNSNNGNGSGDNTDAGNTNNNSNESNTGGNSGTGDSNGSGTAASPGSENEENGSSGNNEGTGNESEDPSKELASDGTALGAGASADAANKAITSAKGDTDIKGSVFNKLRLKQSKATSTSITVSWTKIKNAKKYVVYAGISGKNYKVQRITTTTKTKYTLKKLNKKKLTKGKYYKFAVIALDSKGKVITSSKFSHVATLGKNAASNPSKVTTKAAKNKVTVKVNKTFKLAGSYASSAKKYKVKKILGMRYESTNTKVATVTSKGVIKGVKKGTCYVYAYAQNGLFNKIKVTVK